MDVSIILVSYNTKDLTLECIKSVYDKTQGIDFDIYVVDNNSGDGSCDAIRQAYPNVKTIQNSENKGFGAANNIAIKQSSAKYIFCLNTDTILVNNAIKILFDYMEENENVGVCGGQLYDRNMEITSSVGNFPTAARIFFQYFGLRFIFSKYWKEKLAPAKKLDATSVIPVDYICGADIFFRKSVLDKIGLFDENIFMYGEESDLCYRAKQAGYEVKFIPESKIIHLCGESSKNLNKQKMIQESLLYWYKKNLGFMSFLTLKFAIITTCIVKYIFLSKPEYKELAIYFSRI